MLDINLIRESPDVVRGGMCKVGADPAIVAEVLEVDRQWRSCARNAIG